MIVTSVVLTWNRREDALACLHSLARQSVEGVEHRLLLVDNGSTDGTAEAAQREYPHAAVVRLPDNLGFAAGVNVGIRHALHDGADWTWVVNNDATASPGLLAHLAAAADDRQIGMLTPTIRYMDRPTEVWPSAGWRRGLTLAPFDSTASPPSSEPYDVDWATGCCLLVRAALWRDVGLFDERFRFYYEDHDLCIRAKDAGWRIVHVPAASALHKVAASTGTGSSQQMFLLARGSVPYYARHTHGLQRAIIVPYRIGSALRVVGAACSAGRPGSAAAYARGLLSGIRDMMRSRGRAMTPPTVSAGGR